MAQLHPFKFCKLPPEIRIQIWEIALHQETEKRLVVADVRDHVVYPMRRLISPLLTVNRESREIAKTFFSFTLDVHRIPDPAKRDFFLWVHTPSGPSAGKLYLSLDRDLFTEGPRWEECRYQGSGHLNSDWEILCNYETKPMSSDDCDRVQRVLDIEYGPYDPYNPSCYGIHYYDKIQEWLFKCATDYFAIIRYPNSQDEADFPEEPQKSVGILHTILELGGEGMLALPWVQKRLYHHTIDRTLVEEHIPEEDTDLDTFHDWDEEIISGIQFDDDASE
ncbi:hypothetical protein M434DRAFT_386887 [Hypoxylon sp. CO27-5]|nr:hypothetical protein M434DRAFT_386887 [Hypoxylon sp. CO27-5]